MNKIGFITGASSGIGKATAILMAQNGYDLVLCGRRLDKLQEVQKEIGAKTETILLTFDVGNISEVKNAFENLPQKWQQIDALINNAGNAHGLGPVQENDTNDWDLMISSNITGLLYVSKVIIPTMVANKKGHIVNISSAAGKMTYANGTVYCATKKSVEAISEGMRLDLVQHGIKVTNIAPGAVETDFSLVRFKGDANKANKIYEGYDPLLAQDIADAIVYCLNAPDRVTIADMSIFAKAQANASTIFKVNV